MEYAAVFALSIVVAILYLWAQPKVFGLASLSNVQKNYAGKVALTAFVIFGAIVIAGFLFAVFDRNVSV